MVIANGREVDSIVYGSDVFSKNNSLLPIYQQMNEPSKKEGLWIKTQEKFKDLFFLNENDEVMREWSELPSLSQPFYLGGTVLIGDYIYLFGGGTINTTANKYAYKYNINTGVSTKLADMPYSFHQGSAIAVNDEIYLFGSGATNCTKYTYKYNIETNTYTKLADIPYAFYVGCIEKYNNEIYLFGSYDSNVAKNTYKYNTETNTYTKLADMPVAFTGGASCIYNKKIYLQKGYDLYIYDILTDSYETKGNVIYPANHNSTGVNIFNQFYIMYQNWSTTALRFCKYNMAKNGMYELLPLLNFSTNKSILLKKDSDIYLVGNMDSEYQKKVYKYSLKTLNKKGIYVITCFSNTNKLIPKLSDYITGVILLDGNNKELNYECYIGNGTSWNKFEA